MRAPFFFFFLSFHHGVLISLFSPRPKWRCRTELWIQCFSLSLSLSPFCGREESLQKRWETPKITCHKAFFFRLYPGVGVNGCLFQDAELFEHSFREHSLWWTEGQRRTQTDSGRLGTWVMLCPCRWPQTETAVSILQGKGQIRSGAPAQQEVKKNIFFFPFHPQVDRNVV